MSTRVKAVIITVVFGLAAFFLGPVLWQPAGDVGPAGLQLPLFIIISAVEALAFGLGIAFMILGWPMVKNTPQELRRSAGILYVSFVWFLISWWPHDNMHISNASDDFWRLLLIEYLFHFTLVVAAIAIAYEFFVLFGRCLVLTERKA